MRTAVHVVRNELGQNTSVRRATAAAARSRSNQLAPHKQQAKFYNLQRIANIFMAKYVKHLTSAPAPARNNTHTRYHSCCYLLPLLLLLLPFVLSDICEFWAVCHAHTVRLYLLYKCDRNALRAPCVRIECHF